MRPDVVIFPDQSSPGVWLDKPPGQRWVQISHHQALRFVSQPEIGEHSLRDALTATDLERTQFERCDICIAPTNYMADVVRSFVSTRKRIEVISNIVGEVPDARASPLAPLNRVFIPSGGSRFKGSELVPQVIAGIQAGCESSIDLEFFVSGDLNLAQRKEIARVASGARLVAPGHLSHAETLSHLARSRVCVSPTWIENQSMALLECKALGVPFVAFDVGGNREILGPVDRVVPRGDVLAIVGAAVNLLSRRSEPHRWDFTANNKMALERWAQILLTITQ